MQNCELPVWAAAGGVACNAINATATAKIFMIVTSAGPTNGVTRPFRWNQAEGRDG
jgi:hypothetical protein